MNENQVRVALNDLGYSVADIAKILVSIHRSKVDFTELRWTTDVTELLNAGRDALIQDGPFMARKANRIVLDLWNSDICFKARTP